MKLKGNQAAALRLMVQYDAEIEFDGFWRAYLLRWCEEAPHAEDDFEPPVLSRTKDVARSAVWELHARGLIRACAASTAESGAVYRITDAGRGAIVQHDAIKARQAQAKLMKTGATK